MTNERAKEILTMLICQDTRVEADDYEQALEMAINALSQESICDRDCEHCTWTECPIEPCEDAISREDAIQAVNNTLAEYIPYFRNDQIGIPLKCARALNDLSSVTQKPKYWIDKDNKLYKMPDDIPQKSGKWIYSDLLRVKHGTMNIDALIDKVYADMREEQTE